MEEEKTCQQTHTNPNKLIQHNGISPNNLQFAASFNLQIFSPFDPIDQQLQQHRRKEYYARNLVLDPKYQQYITIIQNQNIDLFITQPEFLLNFQILSNFNSIHQQHETLLKIANFIEIVHLDDVDDDQYMDHFEEFIEKHIKIDKFLIKILSFINTTSQNDTQYPQLIYYSLRIVESIINFHSLKKELESEQEGDQDESEREEDQESQMKEEEEEKAEGEVEDKSKFYIWFRKHAKFVFHKLIDLMSCANQLALLHQCIRILTSWMKDQKIMQKFIHLFPLQKIFTIIQEIQSKTSQFQSSMLLCQISSFLLKTQTKTHKATEVELQMYKSITTKLMNDELKLGKSLASTQQFLQTLFIKRQQNYFQIMETQENFMKIIERISKCKIENILTCYLKILYHFISSTDSTQKNKQIAESLMKNNFLQIAQSLIMNNFYEIQDHEMSQNLPEDHLYIIYLMQVVRYLIKHTAMEGEEMQTNEITNYLIANTQIVKALINSFISKQAGRGKQYRMAFIIKKIVLGSSGSAKLQMLTSIKQSKLTTKVIQLLNELDVIELVNDKVCMEMLKLLEAIFQKTEIVQHNVIADQIVRQIATISIENYLNTLVQNSAGNTIVIQNLRLRVHQKIEEKTQLKENEDLDK